MTTAKKLDDLFILELGTGKQEICLAENSEKNLVIIEDDPIQQEYLKKIGEDFFNKTLCFNSVEHASIYINNVDLKIDIVLIDYFLPGERGTSIVSLMKSLNENAKLYLMTGDLNKIDPEDSHLEDLESYIQKPLSFNQIKKIFES